MRAMLRLLQANSRRGLLSRLFLTAAALLRMSWTLFANSSSHLRSTNEMGCYCHCAGARTLGSCVKMCELPKYASRWWARSCARPHTHVPTDDPGAGPHLHHSNRAEHARI